MPERAVATAKTPEAKQKCSNSCKQNVGFNSSGSTVDMILQLQRTAGNRAVQKLIKKQTLQAESKIDQKIQDLDDDEFVNKTIESFQDPVLKDQIGSKINSRRDFLLGMQQYLGPLEKVIEHFKAIRKVNVPGLVHLHEQAAIRLEMVSKEMKGKMPSTTVALGLRGRYSPHTRNSKGIMAHPLGYAIDYRPTSNPLIKDPRLVKLIQMQIGGSISFELGMDRKKRRELLSKMGSQTAKGGIDPKSDLGTEAAAFFKRFEAEYNRLSEASRKFTTELPEKLTEAKRTLQRNREINKQLKTIENKLNRLKKSKKTDKVKDLLAEAETEKQTLTEEKQRLETEVANIKSDLNTLFKPWLDKIKAEMEAAKKSAGEVDLKTLEMPAKKEAAKEISKATSESKKLLRDKLRTEKSITLLERKIKGAQNEASKSEKSKQAFFEKITAWNNEITKLRSLLEKQNEQLASVKNRLDEMSRKEELRPIKKEWDLLKSLEKALSEDENFVFAGKRAEENPSVMQLIENGFFTPDPKLEQNEEFNSNKHGFNFIFMKLMAEHGFEQGTNWNPGGTDPMHFELVEGVDSIPMGTEKKNH